MPAGLGFGLLGATNTAAIGDAAAQEIFDAAWSLGIRRFDTAALYGGGLSEERLGRLLGSRTRDAYVISTKIGRYRPYDATVTNPADNPGDWFDFSAKTTEKSIEQSLDRLGIDRLDIVFLHDCDAHIEAAINQALPVLQRLKQQGVIQEIGCGSNLAATHEVLLARAEFDVMMVAGRNTLLDQSAQANLFPMALERQVEIELAAPFNSGILAVGSTHMDTRFDYQSPDVAVIARVRQIEAICARHAVPLKHAALAYSAAHPAVSRLVLGLVGPAELASNLEDLKRPIPDALWRDLTVLGIPHPTKEAPLCR